MKKISIVLSTAFVVSSAFAHQISGDDHDGFWNWNNPNHTHTHDNDIHTHDNTTYSYNNVKTETSSQRETITGLTGLEAIAKVGECYIPAYVEPSCTLESKKVMVKEAYEEMEVVPAVTKKVMKKVMISPERVIEERVPALYQEISKRVMVAPARTEWKKGNFTNTTKTIGGETYCLVEVPAQYEDRSEKVLQIPETTRTRVVPAVYREYEDTVTVTPATTRVVRTHPAVYETIEQCVDKEAGKYEWVSVLCEQNATTDVLKDIEQKLADNGVLASSSVDGVIDEATGEAIRKYQNKSGLGVDGLINIETVKSLGVTYK